MAANFSSTDSAFATLMREAGGDILLVERAFAEANRKAGRAAPAFEAVLREVQQLRAEPAAA